MAKRQLSLQRIAFLFVLVAVFLYTYLADLNIFAVVLRTIAYASPRVREFIPLFLVLSFAGLSVYYYFAKISNQQISQRFLAWLKLFTLSWLTSFLISAIIVYLNIYFNKTFGI